MNNLMATYMTDNLVIMTTRSTELHMADIVLDEIALEGLDGKSFNSVRSATMTC